MKNEEQRSTVLLNKYYFLNLTIDKNQSYLLFRQCFIHFIYKILFRLLFFK